MAALHSHGLKKTNVGALREEETNCCGDARRAYIKIADGAAEAFSQGLHSDALCRIRAKRTLNATYIYNMSTTRP